MRLISLKNDFSHILKFNNCFGRSSGLFIPIFLRRVQKGFPLQSLTQTRQTIQTFLNAIPPLLFLEVRLENVTDYKNKAKISFRSKTLNPSVLPTAPLKTEEQACDQDISTKFDLTFSDIFDSINYLACCV